MDKLQNDPEMRDNPFVGLGMAMVPMMVDKMIDAYFTPAQIAAQRQESPLYIKSKAEQPAANKARMNYKTLDSFYVSYDTGINSDMTLVLKRHGLYEWQVKRVELPDNFMDSKNP
ncbi:MAG: hypothetical protein JF615_01155 [Asticcacaulis sp.]|nr:hypothetical protein [Asticcacaulis sp.]